MFLPSNLKNQSEEDKADAERKKAYVRIEQWAINLIPESIRTGVQVNVQEIVCGDPECAPIDTAVAVLFPRYVKQFQTYFVPIIAAKDDKILLPTDLVQLFNTTTSHGDDHTTQGRKRDDGLANGGQRCEAR